MSPGLDQKDETGYAPYSDGHAAAWQPDKDNFQDGEHAEKATGRRISIAEGQVRHKKLGWQRLTVRHCYMPPTSPPPSVLPWLSTNVC